MSERNQSQPNKVLPWLLGTTAVSCGVAAVAFVFRPDLYYSFINQPKDPFEPTAPTTIATASAIPGPSSTPTEEIPLGKGKGKPPVSFEWTLGSLKMTTDIVQSTDSIFAEPNGSHTLAWVHSAMGACAAKGPLELGLHSSPQADKATIPPDVVDRLRKNGIGSNIKLTTEDGTICDYEVDGFDSVEKFGDGPGTYVDYLENNPTGEDLRDPNTEPRLVLTSCDEAAGWDSERHTSKKNVIILGHLVKVIPPKEK